MKSKKFLVVLPIFILLLSGRIQTCAMEIPADTSWAPLGKVTGVKPIRYSTKAIKLTWKKNKEAGYYRIYYSQKKSSNFRCAGITKENHLLVDKLKNHTTYYFYVQLCRSRKKSATDGEPSQTVHLKTGSYRRKTVFAGDSIMQGTVNAFHAMHIGGRKKVVARKGIRADAFYKQKIFDGQTGLQKLISEKPYRIYLMLGMNGIDYLPTQKMIADFKNILHCVQNACPDTDIVLCAVPPVSKSKKKLQPGFSRIPLFNKKIKKLAKQSDVSYFDYTDFLKDSKGYLKAKYSEADGCHWNMAAYAKFAKAVEKYDKSLDR